MRRHSKTLGVSGIGVRVESRNPRLGAGQKYIHKARIHVTPPLIQRDEVGHLQRIQQGDGLFGHSERL